jgi:hypothetical protein
VHDVLSWLAQSRGETSALIDAFVSVATVVVSVIVVAAGVRLLVGFFNWRRRLRTRGSSRNGAAARSIPHGTGRAA